MSFYRGPKIVTEGLVFGYDTGYPVVSGNSDTYRFNLGKPTTNLLEQTGASSLDVRTDIYNNTTKTDLGGGKYRFVNDGTGASTIRLYCNVDDLTNGDTYGCSISYENFNPGIGTSLTLDWCDQNSKAFSVSNYGTAARIHMSGSRSEYNSTYRFLDISLAVSSSIDLFDAQVEAGSASPFTPNSRASDGCLIDLKRTNDIDLTNVSFDSNAQMTFNGTDNRIDTTLYHISGSDHTEEVVIYRNATGTAHGILSDLQFGFYGFYIGSDNKVKYRQQQQNSDGQGGYTYPAKTVISTTSLGTGFYHLVGSFSSANGFRVYINGELDGTDDTDLPFNLSGGRGINHIGVYKDSNATTYNHPFDGRIDIVKCYNRELTQEEVVSNFNAIKNRFNL